MQMSQDCIDAGVHICIAAGNNSFKIDTSVGPGADYNNIVFYGTGSNNYYHRGSSPFDEGALMVGNMDSTPQSATVERKVSSSSTGPGVNIFAAGTDILSCFSTSNAYTDAAYWGNSLFRQGTIGGTFMASQVCGVGALYLQADPVDCTVTGQITERCSAVLKDESNAHYGDTTDIVEVTTGCCLTDIIKLYHSKQCFWFKENKVNTIRT